MKGVLAALHGNLPAREMLSRLLEQGRLPHALCLTGPTGVGKRTVALALARVLMCRREASDDCDCIPCMKIGKGIHPDVRTIVKDGTMLKIDQMRELTRLVRLKPYEADVKLFIVDDADLMNEEAGNALLKTLEEPPPGTYLVLTTARPDVLLPTIRSRCRIVRFQPLPRREVASILASRGMAAPEADRRALFSCGSVGTALSLDLPAAEERRKGVVDLLGTLSRGALASEIWKLAKDGGAEREESEATIELLKTLTRDMALLARVGPVAGLEHPDIAGDLEPIAARLGPEGTIALYRQAEAAREALTHFAPRTLALEVLYLRARELMGALPS
ncbi:MAG: DNA polymerase III subunit [Acidobacteriota bacterium]